MCSRGRELSRVVPCSQLCTGSHITISKKVTTLRVIELFSPDKNSDWINGEFCRSNCLPTEPLFLFNGLCLLALWLYDGGSDTVLGTTCSAAVVACGRKSFSYYFVTHPTKARGLAPVSLHSGRDSRLPVA